MSSRRHLVLSAALLLTACPEKKEAAPPVAAAPIDAGAPVKEAVVTLGEVLAVPGQPDQLPPPVSPADNPTTPEKVELGYRLFFDPRLAKDGATACAQCHKPELGWATEGATDPKVGGAKNTRNSPSLLLVGHNPNFYWDGRMPTLEKVSEAAWKGQLGAEPAAIAKTLNEDSVTRAFFQRAFQTDATAENVPMALAAFLRTLNTGNSDLDHFLAGEKDALSADAKAGWALFQKKGCIGCHVPPLFTDHQFHDLGVNAKDAAEGRDEGRKVATKEAGDAFKFKTPSLRNVAQTAPYFHDGSAKTLEAAISLIAEGRTTKHEPLLKPFKPSAKELKQLVAFLTALNGQATYNEAPPAVVIPQANDEKPAETAPAEPTPAPTPAPAK